MRWIFLLFLTGCYLSEQPLPLPYAPPFLTPGMSQGEIQEILGSPLERQRSQFGRETWTYPNIDRQATYCNRSEEPRLYLFPSSSPTELHLLFGEEGILEDFSYILK